MRESSKPIISFAAKSFLLFLIAAVFLLGLQIKISHYEIHKPSKPSVGAKLVTEKDSERSLVSLLDGAASRSTEQVALPVPAAAPSGCIASLALHTQEPGLGNPCTYDLQGPNRLHLPPPARS